MKERKEIENFSITFTNYTNTEVDIAMTRELNKRMLEVLLDIRDLLKNKE